MRQGIPKEFKDAIPPWRSLEKHRKDLNDYVTILIDQIEEIHPWRNLDNFVKLDGVPVKAPPRSKFTRVKDPLY